MSEIINEDEAVELLAEIILGRFKERAALGLKDGIDAKELHRAICTTCGHFWSNVKIYAYKRRAALVKSALTKLKSDGKLVTEPVLGRYPKRYKNGEFKKPVVGWRYVKPDNVLDALAANIKL